MCWQDKGNPFRIRSVCTQAAKSDIHPPEDTFEVPKTPPAPQATTYPDGNPKTILGIAKPPTSPIPPVAILWLGQAMADGRRKYGPMNWRDAGITASVYYDASMRHMLAWMDGEDHASDSGVHHLAHAMACFAIVLDAMAQGTLNDDRPTKGKFAEVAAALTANKAS